MGGGSDRARVGCTMWIGSRTVGSADNLGPEVVIDGGYGLGGREKLGHWPVRAWQIFMGAVSFFVVGICCFWPLVVYFLFFIFYFVFIIWYLLFLFSFFFCQNLVLV